MIALTQPQKALLKALNRLGGRAGALDLCNALHGPLRASTLRVIARHGLVRWEGELLVLTPKGEGYVNAYKEETKE